MRGRRGLPPREPEGGAAFTDIQPDPSRIGGVAEAPFVRLPVPATLFAARARRFRALAEGHPMAPYLLFLAAIVDGQAAAVAALPEPSPVAQAARALRAAHAMPALSADEIRDNAELAATLAWLLDHWALDAVPEAAQEAAAALAAMPAAERSALMLDVFEGAIPLDRVGEALFAAAALQVHLARLATQFDATSLQPVAEGVCPVCGGPPVSSLVVGWTPAAKARYCACALCGALWNHVRIKCTACAATDGIAYSTLETAAETAASDPEPGKAPLPTAGVETCTTCRSYIKHFQQHADSAIDPLADDVATYALDLLARADDFRRSSFNPLFLTG